MAPASHSGDLAGISLSAIQALAAENAALRQQLAEETNALKQQLAEVQTRENERDTRLARLEALLTAEQPIKVASSK